MKLYLRPQSKQKWLPPHVCPPGLTHPAPLYLLPFPARRPSPSTGGASCPEPGWGHLCAFHCLSEWWGGKWMNERKKWIKETKLNSFELSRKKLYLLHKQWLQHNAQHKTAEITQGQVWRLTSSQRKGRQTGFLQESPSYLDEKIPKATHVLKCSIKKKKGYVLLLTHRITGFLWVDSSHSWLRANWPHLYP